MLQITERSFSDFGRSAFRAEPDKPEAQAGIDFPLLCWPKRKDPYLPLISHENPNE